MKLEKWLWSATWWRANLEGWLLAAPLLALLAYAARWMDTYTLFQGVVLIGAAAPSLVGLRSRAVAGDFGRILLLETIQTAAITLGLYLTEYALLAFFQEANTLVKLPQVPDILVFLVSGGVYLFWRVFRWAWLRWSALRDKSFAWSLTQSFMVLVSGLVLATVILVMVFLNFAGIATMKAAAPPTIQAIAKIISFLFFVLLAAPFALLPALLVLLPPMAGASYWVSRRMTRRLDRLAAAATRLSQGDWSSRVEPAGKDEIARLQASFNRMAGELEKANRAMAEQRDRVSAALKAQRELTTSVSHELRTPVATALAYLENDLDRLETLPPDTLRKDLEITHHEIVRLQVLIDDLFTLAKAEVNQLSLELCAVELAPLLAGAVAASAGLAWDKRRVRVQQTEPGQPLPAVWADPSRVEQVMRNLLSNGVRHTPPGGFVLVSAETVKDHVRVTITDSGAGILPEDLPHIFERFYRGSGEPAPTGTPGAGDGRSGLGLAIVKELVESMGGSVQVASEPDQGSTFTINFKT
jgi:signal transduction histidine kinase